MNTYDVFATWEKYRSGERMTLSAQIDAKTPNAAINKMRRFIRTGQAVKRGRLVQIVAYDKTTIPF